MGIDTPPVLDFVGVRVSLPTSLVHVCGKTNQSRSLTRLPYRFGTGEEPLTARERVSTTVFGVSWWTQSSTRGWNHCKDDRGSLRPSLTNGTERPHVTETDTGAGSLRTRTHTNVSTDPMSDPVSVHTVETRHQYPPLVPDSVPLPLHWVGGVGYRSLGTFVGSPASRS